MSQLPTIAPAAFDYAALQADVAKEARAAAKRIRSHEHSATQSILEIGRDLIAIKARLDHGQFVSWVEAECAAAVRTVQNYMKAAQAFDGKDATIAHLRPTVVYALAAAPAPARDTILERIEAGERPSEAAIRDAIYDARAVEKAAKQEAKLTPEQRKAKAKARAKTAADQAKRREQIDKAEADRQQATQRAAEIIRAALQGKVADLCQQLELSQESTRLLWELAPEKMPRSLRAVRMEKLNKETQAKSETGNVS